MIVVTGAGGSLGPHVARALAEQGHQVCCCDTDTSRLEGLPGEHVAIDLLDEDATREWAASRPEVTGVVHLVGGWRGGTPVAATSDEDVRWLEERLFLTVRRVSAAFAAPLAASGRGRFLLLSSAQVDAPAAGNAAYAAAKAAAETWTLAFGRELAEHGGAANILAVNAIVTRAMREAEPGKAFKTFTDAEDIAAALVFLCSDAGAAMRGQRLALHG